MGSHDYICTIRKQTQAEVKAAWLDRVEEDRRESGEGSYAGNATTLRGPIKFLGGTCASEREARELILDRHEKWSGPLAVAFHVDAPETEKDKARKAKAIEKFEGVEQKQYDAERSIVQAFIERKSGLIGCKGCGSKLAHEQMKQRVDLGSMRECRMNINGLPKTRDFRRPTLPVCPVCGASLLSETDAKRVATHQEKVTAARAELTEALKPKQGKEVAWAVGGWAAS